MDLSILSTKHRWKCYIEKHRPWTNIDLKDVPTGGKVVHCQRFAMCGVLNVVRKVNKCISILNNVQVICQQSQRELQ